MIEGKTTSGFEYSIEEYKLDNWELWKVLNELGDSPNKIVSVLPYLFDEEQIKHSRSITETRKRALYQHQKWLLMSWMYFKNNKAKN